MDAQLDLFTPADARDEFGQLVIEQQTDTLGNALRQLQQRLTEERRDIEYRWRAPPAREHYTVTLDVARRVLEIQQTCSNGVTLQAQVKTSTMNVRIEECPDIDELLQVALTGCKRYGNNPTLFRLLRGLSSPEKIGLQLNHD